MSISDVLNVLVPIASLVAGWLGRGRRDQTSKAAAADVGERLTRYANGATEMLAAAVAGGHVPLDRAALVEGWIARFKQLCAASSVEPSPEVITRALGKSVRGLVAILDERGQLGGLDGGRLGQVLAGLEAAFLAAEVPKALARLVQRARR